MTIKARDKIAAGLREAIAVANGDLEPARMHVPAQPGCDNFVLDWQYIRKEFGVALRSFFAPLVGIYLFGRKLVKQAIAAIPR